MTPDQEEIKKIVESSYLKADHQFECPPVCLEIAGKYNNQTFATLGNFSAMLALPKVGKTTATGIIVSALLAGKQVSNFIPKLPDNKKGVVWIDTEQGGPECLKVIRNISSQVTGNKDQHPANLIFSSLRKYNKEVRISATEYIITNTPNIGFVVIDGIRDFVSSINDEREATRIADYLLKWTQEFNIHILAIIHQNKGDINARGHLGSELMNKAETVVTLSRVDYNGKRVTKFEPKYTRHKEFEEFAFTVDDDGKITDSEIQSTYEPKNPTVTQLSAEQLHKITLGCFANSSQLPYSKLWPQLKKTLSGQLEIEFGDNKCKALVTRLQNENYICYQDDTKHYFANVPSLTV